MSARALDPTPIGVAYARLAAEDPERPAVTAGSTTRTRAEFEARTNRLARAYTGRGVRPGTLVTIALPTGAEFLEAVVATWKAGATPQPVSNRLPERELAEIIALADPSLIVGVDGDPRRNTVASGFEPDTATPATPLPPLLAGSLKAPTSGGSTGRPKLIVSTDPASAEALAGYGSLMRISPEGVALSTGPLSHNAPLLTATAALVTGCHVVVLERFDAATALAAIGEHRVQWMYSVPTMLQRFAALDADTLASADISSLRTVITMAAHCPQSTRDFCLDFFGPDVMVELYAATEAHAATVIDGHGWLDRPGSVGRVVLGEIEARDETGEQVPADVVGELWMRRDAQTAGPYRYVGSTPQGSADGWETVGDLGQFDTDGYLYLADRKTDMIIVGGSNVYPAEVEGALEEHPAVDTACVVGVPDREYGQTVHAVLNLAAPVSDAELSTHLAERLVRYKIPRTFHRVDEPLRDAAGKMRRRRVRDDLFAAVGVADGGPTQIRSDTRLG